jgi:zinc transporter 1
VFLVAVCIFIFKEALERYIDIEPIENPLMILIVGGLGMAVNLIGMIMFCGHAHSHGGSDHGHSHDHSHNHSHNHSHKKKGSRSLNMCGVFLHVFGDFLGSIGVMISASMALIWPPEDHPWVAYIDPSLSVGLAILILFTSLPLVYKCSKILLQAVPGSIDLKKLEQDIRNIRGVIDVHELHVWRLVSTKIICSVHITCQKGCDFMELAEKIRETCHKFGIHSPTIQPEYVDCFHKFNERRELCQLGCGRECSEHSCCENKKNYVIKVRKSINQDVMNGNLENPNKEIEEKDKKC